MKLKQRKNFGFIATFVCLSLIFAGVSPSVLCETPQERGRLNGTLSDLDNLSGLCDFKSEEKPSKTNTNFKIKSLKIAEELHSSLFKFLQDFRIIEKLARISNGLQAVFAEKLALKTDRNAFSLKKILKPSVFNSDKENLNSYNFTIDKPRSIFPTGIDFHISFQDKVFTEFALSVQNKTRVQIHRKDEISRILPVHCFPRASI
jgi:hypothetical protein